MTLKEFAEKMADQYDDLAPDELKADTKFREVGDFTSIVALTIIAMIDEECGVTLSGDDMRKCQTVVELYDMVQSRL